MILDAITAAKSYLEEHGLDKIDDLPPETIASLKSALIENYGDEAGFVRAASDLGIEEKRATLIYNTEVHEAENIGSLETASETGATSKTWTVSGSPNMCDECAAMDGEKVPIDEPFSNGLMTAHLHPNCSCSMTYGPAFTREEIKAMSKEDYAANRDDIFDALSKGQIK